MFANNLSNTGDVQVTKCHRYFPSWYIHITDPLFLSSPTGCERKVLVHVSCQIERIQSYQSIIIETHPLKTNQLMPIKMANWSR